MPIVRLRPTAVAGEVEAMLIENGYMHSLAALLEKSRACEPVSRDKSAVKIRVLVRARVRAFLKRMVRLRQSSWSVIDTQRSSPRPRRVCEGAHDCVPMNAVIRRYQR
jgi:hypothetical protein